MPIQQPEIWKALRFLHITNNQDVYPTLDEVASFATEKEPDRHGIFRVIDFGNALTVNSSQLGTYLEESRLVDVVQSRVHLSDAGHALVRAKEKSELAGQEDVIEVVGRASDPVFYAKLLTQIGKLDDALLVDPYMPSSDLYSILELPNVTRILTNKGHGKRKLAGEEPEKRKGAMALALGAFEARPELRMQSPKNRELHDRVVLPRTGRGIMLGTSLGGTQLTVVTHLTEDATGVLLKHYETVFDSALSVEPIARVIDS